MALQQNIWQHDFAHPLLLFLPIFLFRLPLRCA